MKYSQLHVFRYDTILPFLTHTRRVVLQEEMSSGETANATILPPDVIELESAAESSRLSHDHTTALRCLERALVGRAEAFGHSSPEVTQACISTANYCNFLAMKCLEADNVTTSRTLLRRAQTLVDVCKDDTRVDLSNSSELTVLRITTWNNLACVSRRQGHVRAALAHLHHAIHLESKVDACHHSMDVVDTYLNACAIESSVGRHDRALGHAQTALIRLQERRERRKKEEEKEEDYVIALAIAYHNIAVEQEYLGNVALSSRGYRKAASVAQENLGPDHRVTQSLQVSLTESQKTQPRDTHGRAKKKGARSRRGEKHHDATLRVKSAYHASLELSRDTTTTTTTKTKTSPSRKEVKRFDSAFSAYGRIPGVPTVKFGQPISRLTSTRAKRLTFDPEVVHIQFSQPPPVERKVLEMITPRGSEDEQVDNVKDRQDESRLGGDGDRDAEIQPEKTKEFNDETSRPILMDEAKEDGAIVEHEQKNIEAEKIVDLDRIDVPSSSSDTDAEHKLQARLEEVQIEDRAERKMIFIDSTTVAEEKNP